MSFSPKNTRLIPTFGQKHDNLYRQWVNYNPVERLERSRAVASMGRKENERMPLGRESRGMSYYNARRSARGSRWASGQESRGDNYPTADARSREHSGKGSNPSSDVTLAAMRYCHEQITTIPLPCQATKRKIHENLLRPITHYNSVGAFL